MFESHPDFEELNDEALLWRYQDLPRYLDLLLRKSLFFNRVDKFEDPFEGKFNKYSKEAVINEVLQEKGEEPERRKIETQFEELLEEVSENRVAIAVSSWHINNAENYAMWNIYGRGSYGLAIQTTFQRLKQSFQHAENRIHVGKVIYYDEQCEQIPIGKTFAPFLRKRRMYQYEEELRCCTPVCGEAGTEANWEAQDELNGIFVPVDLDMLIERIYISPFSPDWFRALIERVNKQFGIRSELRHSAVFNSENFF